MGGADIADQIQGSYRYNHWCRRYKWWHSIFWWGVQVQMVNSYQVYRKYNENQGLIPMSHYEFQSRIARACLGKTLYETSSEADSSSKDISPSVSSMSETNESKRRCRFCESSLHPLTGGLKCRLNRLISHWPVSTSSVQHYCQLCYW